jgi:uncharacterized membrane protein
MSETAQQDTKPESGGTERGVAANFKAMPVAERMLAGASLGVLLFFVFRSAWSLLFHRWFETLAVLGALGVMIVTGASLWRVKLLGGAARTYVLVALGALPAVGFVVDEFKDGWRAAMLAGSVVMGWAAFKITTREDLF